MVQNCSGEKSCWEKSRAVKFNAEVENRGKKTKSPPAPAQVLGIQKMWART
jgi:hypothetical protein